MSPSAPQLNSSLAKLARKNLCNNTHTERAGAIRVVENINSIKLCLSLFAVRLETRDLST
jgi:hypothetical protein